MNQLIVLAQWVDDAPLGYKVRHLFDGLFTDAPFSQWGDVSGGDVPWLLPVVAVIAFLVWGGVRGGGGDVPKRSASGGGSWTLTKVGVGLVAVALLFNSGALA